MFPLKCFENFALGEFSSEMIQKLSQNQVYETFEGEHCLEIFVLGKISDSQIKVFVNMKISFTRKKSQMKVPPVYRLASPYAITVGESPRATRYAA